MEYILLICGLIAGIGIGTIVAFEVDRESEFEQKIKDKKAVPSDMIYNKKLVPLEEGYEYTGYYAFCDDKWYPVIRKVEENE